jgi:hypothetical protein
MPDLPKSWCIPAGRGAPDFDAVRLRLPDDAYADALRAFPILCADVYPVHRGSRTMWLAWRTQRPAVGWWCVGGRVLLGEDGPAAAIRHCEADSGMRFGAERFAFVGLQNYYFHDRAQAPQDTPCHSVCYCFALALDDGELARFGAGLGAPEYRAGSFRAFDRAALREPSVEPALLDVYDRIFPA